MQAAFDRLKQTDFNGETSYSEVLAVQFGSSGDPQLWPNPATGGQFSVLLHMLTAGNLYLQVYDMAGRQVFETGRPLSQGQNAVQVEMPAGLPAGLYLVEMHLGRQAFRRKLVVH